MGTYYTDGASRRDIVADLTKGWESETARSVTLKNCLRGNVLWTVEEVTPKGDKGDRFIGCYLLRPHPRGWGYKPMSESMGPYYYTCPLGYLNMVPVADAAWREDVRSTHANKVANQRLKRAVASL